MSSLTYPSVTNPDPNAKIIRGHCMECGHVSQMIFDERNVEARTIQCGMCGGFVEKAPPDGEHPVLIRCEEPA